MDSGGKIVYKKWQMRRLVFWFCTVICLAGVFLSLACWSLHDDKVQEEVSWQEHLQEENISPETVALLSAGATEVTTGMYIESLKEINMKSSNYSLTFRVWFMWEGDEELDMVNNFHIYNGKINSKNVVKDEIVDGVHYQLCSVDATIVKKFWTKRFPLESHQLRFYIEPDYPIDKVVFKADEENSAVNPSFGIAGYKFMRADNAVFTQQYVTTYGDPSVQDAMVTSEFMTQIELNRDGFGLYVKCFIALLGTSLWIFITMFLCTSHRVDPLSMIPAALFGTVSNIMVGANLLPDALEIGLLEYVNLWGILTILAGAMAIININRIRSKFRDNNFAYLFGRIITTSIIFFIILGHILMPIAAYYRR